MATIRSLSTINVRLSAVRKMVEEARRAGMIGREEAATLTDIPNIRQKGTSSKSRKERNATEQRLRHYRE